MSESRLEDKGDDQSGVTEFSYMGEKDVLLFSMIITWVNIEKEVTN